MIDRFKSYLESEKKRSNRTVSTYTNVIRKFKRYVGKDLLLVVEGNVHRHKKFLVKKGLKNWQEPF